MDGTFTPREFEIVSLNTSARKGERKTPVPRVTLVVDQGLEGDAHAGDGLRQVSLLAAEDIDEMIRRGARVGPGDFAENITTRGIPLADLPLGTLLTIGEVALEVTQIGKECHTRCAIFQQVGDCIMPRRGIFARVRQGGEISHESLGHYRI